MLSCHQKSPTKGTRACAGGKTCSTSTPSDLKVPNPLDFFPGVEKPRQHAYLQMSYTLDLDVGPQGQLVHTNAGPTLYGSQKIRSELCLSFPL